MRSRSLLMIGIAGALFGARVERVANAQPDRRDHRQPHDMDHHPPAGVVSGPTEAPPPPREERQAARAGFVWIPGKWNWAGKWDWVAGHWERERAGKAWRQGHWDKNGSAWTFVEGEWVAGGEAAPAGVPPGPPMPPQANDHRPHQAPPPPREERQAVRAGFVWAPGRWDWKVDKWDWVAGHWERERAGKKWREARWEEHDGAWQLTEGDWIDANAAVPPPPTGAMPPAPMEDHHHEWKMDRPTVSSYWPQKGKAGTRVVIHGRNFPPDASVMWGPEPVTAAKVRADEIEFRVPPTAQSATILLKRGNGRDMIVGNFEVANFDAEADAKRIAAEREKAAQAAWAASQAGLAKDQAARQAALEARWQQQQADREQRRHARVAEVRAKWEAAFLGDPDTQGELTLHSQRIADLARAKDVAQVTNNSKLGVRIDVATGRENDRHDQRMAALHDAFKTKGGAP